MISENLLKWILKLLYIQRVLHQSIRRNNSQIKALLRAQVLGVRNTPPPSPIFTPHIHLGASLKFRIQNFKPLVLKAKFLSLKVDVFLVSLEIAVTRSTCGNKYPDEKCQRLETKWKFCRVHRLWMSKNCKETCGLCPIQRDEATTGSKY